MPEMKHNFTKGRMNKDLDERLLPKGEYRDALNIEVSTSEGSDVGSLQTTLGNLIVSEPNNSSEVFPRTEQPSVVGKVEDGRNNRIIYFVNKPVNDMGRGEDLIIGYDVETGVSEVIFRDVWQVEALVTQVSNNSASFYIGDTVGIKPNMTILRPANALTGSGSVWPYEPEVLSVNHVDYLITVKNGDTSNSWALNDKIRFSSKRVLNFKTTAEPNQLITGINIIDDLLFWTDNNDEPKKINIKRSILGSQNLAGFPTLIEGIYHPTRLIVNGGDNYTNPLTGVNYSKGYVEHSHVTVIRQAPTLRPKIHLARTKRNISYDSTTDSFSQANVLGTTSPMVWFRSGDLLQEGDTKTVTLTNTYLLDYEIGDVLIFNLTSLDPGNGIEDYSIMATIVSFSGMVFVMNINSVDRDVENVSNVWNVALKQEKPLFEFKFPRFASRYKYEDGEYSTFSPWSEVAFLPTDFDYLPKKGYNLGMVNDTRWLAIRDFIPHNIPLDVVEVDILYKEENSPNIYTVKTIKSANLEPFEKADTEWDSEALVNGVTTVVGNTGFFVLEKDLIHATLPANQLLRPWDNVPRKAKAQEVSSNRVIYGNYIQNFDLTKGNGNRYIPAMDVMIVDRINSFNSINFIGGKPTGTTQAAVTNSLTITITAAQALLIKVGSKISATNLTTTAYVIDVNATTGLVTLSDQVTIGSGVTVSFDETFTTIPPVPKQPEKSIKSMRTYQVGVIYIDDFGREIPVQSSTSGTFTVDKERANKYNQIKARIQGGPPVWAKYFRYYVKETSNEYYNLAMDRWYSASDGNIWISFPSSERNKVDEETFIILKKGHDSDKFVTEKARYKILAIENDAPDFIKEEYTDFESGLATFHFDGLIRVGKAFFAVSETSISESALDQPVSDLQNGRGKFALRVTLGTKKSAWYNLTTVTIHEQDDSYKRFIVDRPFDEDTLFALNNGQNGQNTGTRIEIRQTVLENKPEFDGRFFVKIHKDSIIEKYIYREAAAPQYAVMHAKKHFTLVGTGAPKSYKKDFWKETPQSGWETVINATQDSHPDRTGWFIDMMVGAQQEVANDSTDERDQGIGFFKPLGIAHKGSYLHLSYSWLHEADNSDKNPKIDATHHQAAMAFRGAIETPGTLCRWANDPDGVIYEIKSSWGYSASNSNVYGVEGVPGTAGKKIDVNVTQYVNNWDRPLNQGGSGNDHESNHRHRFNLHLQTIKQTTPTGKVIPKGLPVGLDDSWDGTGGSYPDLDGSWHPLDQGALNNTSVNGYNGTTAKGHPYMDGGGSVYSQRKANSITDNGGSGSGVSRKNGEWGTNNGVDLPKIFDHDHYYLGNTRLTAVSQVRATGQMFEIVEPIEQVTAGFTTTNPGIWETEPKQDVGLDIYYEASRSLRTRSFDASLGDEHGVDDYGNLVWQWLDYYNCFSFANGVESNRIRDDYNALQITKGVKASTTLAEQFKEERRETGLIFSGIYNSTSGVNNLNQFIQAEAITKDLNPTYGSIQKLFGRDTDILAFCEDKVLKIMANKDALFNADGKMNVTSNNAVLGQAVPFVGDYGISTDPESFASDEFRCYFTDKQRGAVLRLSRDGITNIAEHGMEDYFSDNLTFAKTIIGSFDTVKKTYNLTLNDYGTANGLTSFVATPNTSSFSETVKGWTSFKSFIQSCGGISLNNSYYTFNKGNMWIHHENYGSSAPVRNNFYGDQYDSSVTFILNENPSSVKSFNTLNYEGTQSKITENDTDDEYYNNNPKSGWYCSSIQTDLQEGKQLEFKDKEGKWFNTIHGIATTLNNLDSKEFSVQGIGNPSDVDGGNPQPTLYDLTVQGITSSCTVPCGTPLNVSGSRGQYHFSMDMGSATGVAVITFNPGMAHLSTPVPDELVYTFNSVSKNTFSTRSGGYQQGLIGAPRDTALCNNNTTYKYTAKIASGTTERNSSCQVNTEHNLIKYVYDASTSTFAPDGTTSVIPLYARNTEPTGNLGTLGPTGYSLKGAQTLMASAGAAKDAVGYVSIPQNYSGNTVVDFCVNAVMGNTWWGIEVSCASTLQLVEGSTAVGSNVCGATINQNYYHIPVHAKDSPPPPVGRPMQNDYIFEDAYGVVPLPAGNYRLREPGTSNTYNAVVGITDQKGNAVAGIIQQISSC